MFIWESAWLLFLLSLRGDFLFLFTSPPSVHVRPQLCRKPKLNKARPQISDIWLVSMVNAEESRSVWTYWQVQRKHKEKSYFPITVSCHRSSLVSMWQCQGLTAGSGIKEKQPKTYGALGFSFFRINKLSKQSCWGVKLKKKLRELDEVQLELPNKTFLDTNTGNPGRSKMLTEQSEHGLRGKRL